jgi:hypothetical protein
MPPETCPREEGEGTPFPHGSHQRTTGCLRQGRARKPHAERKPAASCRLSTERVSTRRSEPLMQTARRAHPGCNEGKGGGGDARCRFLPRWRRSRERARFGKRSAQRRRCDGAAGVAKPEEPSAPAHGRSGGVRD